MLNELIADKKFEEILVFLQDEKNRIDPLYVDPLGNNLIHLILMAMHEKIKEFYRPFQFRKTMLCDDLKPSNQKSETLIEQILSIFLLLKKMGCSFCHKNSENKTTLDLLRSIEVAYFDKNLLKKMTIFLVKAFELDANSLLPGRKYVTDLGLFRGAKNPKKRVEIPDALSAAKTSLSLHQVLASYEYHLDRFGLGSAAKNFAVATMSFVVSSKPHAKNGSHERRLVTLPVYLENLATKVDPGKHSEKALIDNLKRDLGLQSESRLVTQLFQICDRQPGIKVYNVVLDFHSTREVCQDCGTHLREFQTDLSPTGFTHLLAAQLKRSGFVVSEKKQTALALVLRASGLDDPSWSGTPDPLVVPPMFYSEAELSRDIRHCSPGVLFHLPPMTHRAEKWLPIQAKRYHSDLLGDSDSEQMDQEYKRRKSGLSIDVSPFHIQPFTAFANGGGKAKDEAAKQELTAELVELSDGQLARVMSI